MNNKKSKFYFLCLGLIVTIGLLVIFFKINEEKNSNILDTQGESNTKNKSKKVRLSVCIPQNAWAGETLDPALVNSVKTAMEVENNIEIELIAPTADKYNETLDKMLASGNIPDVYLLRNAMNNLQLYTVNGYTRDITAFVEKDDNIKKAIDKIYLNYMTVNGQIHALPRYKPISKVIWLRKDIIDRYGIELSETPTTDEFLKEMKKLADKNIVPFSFPKFLDNLAFFYNAFNTCGGIGKNSNGLYYDGFNTPETKQALSYMNTLYNEGIWDKEFDTNENSIIRQKLISGKTASNIDYSHRYIYYMSEGVSKNSFFDLQPIYMLKGPKGGTGNLNEAVQDAFVVSPTCKNPEASVSFLSWLTTSENSAKINLVGIEGKHYTVENGVIKATEIAKASGYKATATNVLLTHTRIKDFGFKWDPITEKYFPVQEAIANENSKYLGPNIIIPGGISPLYDKNAAAYKKKIEELAYKIITGTNSMESCYKEYEEFWDSINGDQMLIELNKKN